jgi:hypothetical protein
MFSLIWCRCERIILIGVRMDFGLNVRNDSGVKRAERVARRERG